MAGEPTPAESLTTIDIHGSSRGPKSTRIETESAELVIDKEASPLEYMLGSLAACINVIGHLVAKDHDVTIDGLKVDVEGDIDPAKYQGEATEPRAGFQTIRVRVSVDADADADILREWIDEVAERCPVADNLRNTSDVEVTVDEA